MQKPQVFLFKIFSARLAELNNYLPIFPGSSATKNMAPEELNKILLQAAHNSWAKQAYLQGWVFEGSYYKYTCDMFERMEIAESIYERGAPSQNTQRLEAKCSSLGRKQKGLGSTSASNPKRECWQAQEKRWRASYRCADRWKKDIHVAWLRTIFRKVQSS